MKNFNNLLRYKLPTRTYMLDEPKTEEEMAYDILDTIKIELIEKYIRKKKLENICKE